MLAIPIYQWRDIGDSLSYWRWYPTGIIQLKKKDNQVVLFAYPHDVFVKLKITETKFKPDQCKLNLSLSNLQGNYLIYKHFLFLVQKYYLLIIKK